MNTSPGILISGNLSEYLAIFHAQKQQGQQLTSKQRRPGDGSINEVLAVQSLRTQEYPLSIYGQRLGMVVHAFNPSIWAAKTRGTSSLMASQPKTGEVQTKIVRWKTTEEVDVILYCLNAGNMIIYQHIPLTLLNVFLVVGMYVFVFVCVYVSVWCWALNTGLCMCQTGTLPQNHTPNPLIYLF